MLGSRCVIVRQASSCKTDTRSVLHSIVAHVSHCVPFFLHFLLEQQASSFDSGLPVLPSVQTDGVQVEYKNGGTNTASCCGRQCGRWDGGFPEVGHRYMLQPGHIDPTFNMYDWVVGVRKGFVEGVWPIMGRGPGQ